MELTIGVDVGGSKIAAGVVDEDGRVLDQVRNETPVASAEAVEDGILTAVKDLRGRHDVTAVGVAVPGFVDEHRSRVRFTPNLPMRDRPIRESVSSRIGLPVATELAIRGVGLDIDVATVSPGKLPDVHRGAPVTILGRYRGAADPRAAIELSGTTLGEPLRVEVVREPVSDPAPWLAASWARAAIRDLEDRYAVRANRETEQAIVTLSKRYGVLSRFTAYLAERDLPVTERDGKFRYPPNLLLVDGGKGQLNVARRVVESLGLDDEIPVAALAKRFEEVYLPDRSEPVEIPRGSEALFMLQRIRDEAHRFANTYHGERRSKRMTASALDGIPGLGEARKKRLVKAMGGVNAVKRADLADLKALSFLPDAVAEAIHAKFRP